MKWIENLNITIKLTIASPNFEANNQIILEFILLIFVGMSHILLYLILSAQCRKCLESQIYMAVNQLILILDIRDDIPSSPSF